VLRSKPCCLSFVNTSHDTGWIATDDGVWWDVPRDNRPSSHRAALANRATRQDGHTTTNPAVCINVDLPAQTRTPGSQSSLGINRQCRRVDIDVRSDVAAVSNLDFACVENSAVLPDGDILSDADVIAVVAVERCFDDDIIAHPANWRHW